MILPVSRVRCSHCYKRIETHEEFCATTHRFQMKPLHIDCFDEYIIINTYGRWDGKFFKITELPSDAVTQKYQKRILNLGQKRRGLVDLMNRARAEKDHLAYVIRGLFLFGFEFGMFFVKLINPLVPRFLKLALRGYDQSWREYESRLPGGY